MSNRICSVISGRHAIWLLIIYICLRSTFVPSIRSLTSLHFSPDLEEVTIDAELLTDEEHVALRQVDRKFGCLYELQLDNAGQLNVQPMTYAKAVDSIGRSTSYPRGSCS